MRIVEFVAAFDSVSGEPLWRIMATFIRLINLHLISTTMEVKVSGLESTPLEV